MHSIIASAALLALVSLAGTQASADWQAPQTLTQKNSKCRVESSGGEYPMFKIFKGKKAIYEPNSDGIVNAKFSPDGKYVALAGGEIDLIEGFGVMIVNCQNEKRYGYLKNQPTYLKSWKPGKLIHGEGELKFRGPGAMALP